MSPEILYPGYWVGGAMAMLPTPWGPCPWVGEQEGCRLLVCPSVHPGILSWFCSGSVGSVLVLFWCATPARNPTLPWAWGSLGQGDITGLHGLTGSGTGVGGLLACPAPPVSPSWRLGARLSFLTRAKHISLVRIPS